MAFAPNPSNYTTHDEGEGRFYVRGQRFWRERPPIFNEVFNGEPTPPDIHLDHTIQTPTKLRGTSMDWFFTLSPHNDTNLQLSFQRLTDNAWLDMTAGSTDVPNVQYTMYEGANRWHETDWQSAQPSNSHGLFINWPDGHWKLKDGSTASLQLQMLAVDDQWSHVFSELLWWRPEGSTLVGRAQFAAKIIPRTLGTVRLLPGMVQPPTYYSYHCRIF